MRLSKRSFRALAIIALGLTFLSSFSPRSASADTVTSSDFRGKSFSKVVDWFDYVRQYAADNGFPCDLSCQNDHAYLYTNFINVGGFQLFYVGLVNATHNSRFVTIPLQTFFEHYKTPAGKTAVTASSFISLVAFKENSSSIYPNSPDRNDTLYASFSLGFDLPAFAGRPVPSYVATSQMIPLTSTNDNHWTWGLKYTNLNAIWWRIGVDPLARYWDRDVPRALARYAELSFTYDLTIDPTAKTAKLVASYTIGKMTDLWLLAQSPVLHLNSTGTYYLNQTRALTETIYDYLQTSQYKISIVLAQKSILVSQNTSQIATEKDDSGTVIPDDSEQDLSRAAINTEAPDGEPVFKADFGVKPTYQLYDSNDSNPATYNAITRTVRRAGWGGNPVFFFQNRFMGFLPLFVAHVDPALIQQARSGLVSFEVADYLYIISYQQWGGTRIVHDPDFTAFYQPSNNAGLVTALFIAVVAAAAVGGVFAFLFRRRKAANIAVAGYPGQAPPTQGPSPTSPPPSGR